MSHSHLLENEDPMFHLSHQPPHLLNVYLPVVQMAHFKFSNAIIQGGTFNSAQGGLHVDNRDSKSGMHDFRSVQKSILIDDPMKDFIP